MKTTLTQFAALTLLCAVPLAIPSNVLAGDGADWPQWRGPDRTGVSVETGWSTVGKSLWAKPLGFGHSSFAVSNGRLYTMGYDLERKLDVVYCLDAATGEEQWTHTYPAEFWNEGHDGGTTTTPSVDGNTIFTSNREGRLFSLRADTGSVIWSHDLQAELEVKPPRWGFAGSPVVVGESVIMNVGKVAAFEKATGKLNWVTEKGYGNAYSTPIEYDFNGTPSMLVLNGLGLAVIDQADGNEITFYDWTRNPEQAVYGATPVVVGDRIFISAAAGGGCVMLQPTDDDTLKAVWENRMMRSQNTGCVLYEDHLYGFDSSILKCIDLDGNEKWRQRGIGHGAMVVVGGRLLIIGAKGELIIAEANPEKYIELSREKVLEGGAFWSTPVLSNGLVYARNSLGDMVCHDYRASGDTVSKTEVATTGDLPDAKVLLANHVKASGGAAALEGLKAVHFTGKGERHGGPIEHCDATLSWSADGAFVWRFSTGLEFGFNPELGWNQSQQGATVLDEDAIIKLREAGDLHRVLAPNWGFKTLETIDTRVFDDRQCYTVAATKPDGTERTLFFEVDTGLLAGQEGEDTSLWVYNDYREIDGVTLPMSWSFFASDSGSMTLANFSEVSLNNVDSENLQPPLLIRMQTRTDEEKEQANVALRAKYSDFLGNFKLATGSMTGTPIIIQIAEGGLQFSFGGQPPSYLTEPDEEGRLYDMTNSKIYIQIDRDDSGAITLMRVFAYGDEFGKLERVAEED